MTTILAASIKRERKRLGMTQDAVAQALRPHFSGGVYPSRATVANWEIDRADVPAEVLPWLARLFKVTTDSLLGLPAKAARNVLPTVSDLGAAEPAGDGHAAAVDFAVGAAGADGSAARGQGGQNEQ